MDKKVKKVVTSLAVLAGLASGAGALFVRGPHRQNGALRGAHPERGGSGPAFAGRCGSGFAGRIVRAAA